MVNPNWTADKQLTSKSESQKKRERFQWKLINYNCHKLFHFKHCTVKCGEFDQCGNFNQLK